MISSIFLMFLLFLFFAFAAGPDKWIECKSSCPTADNACPPATGNKCCNSGEKLPVDGTNYCCISNTWVAPSNDICDGLDNDCDGATDEDEAAPNCALQTGVCAGSKKSCGGASGWLACTSANYGSNYESTESACGDGLDNDCDGTTDCADSDCAGKAGPGVGVTCCQTTANCGNDDCKLESCQADKTCSITNRPAGATDECGTCQACDAAGGNCAAVTSSEGKNCAGSCTYCNVGTCTNRAQGATDECGTCKACNTAGGNCVVQSGNEGKGCVGSCTYCNAAGTCTDRPAGATDECGTCQACNVAGSTGVCAGISDETGKGCVLDCYDCVSGTCTATTENNDGTCADDCNYCNSGSCTNRDQCANNECPAGQYCDAAGGNCVSPDSSSAVCLNCAPDQTAATWTWTPPNHQDAGKGYNSNLFNSNVGACLPSSCSDNNAAACACYDSTGADVKHKGSLGSGTCCGDDINEYYKPDYYGPECTNDVNDCVWSDGNAQAADTGNKEYWCYLHEWNECKVNADIGKKAGGVTCAGTSSNKKWTPNSLVLTENQYSCTDGLDNDGDTKIDCADSDCAGTISGSVKDTNNNPIGSAKIDVLKNAVVVHTAFANALGSYIINNNQDVICGSYDIIASSSGYVSSAKTMQLQPNQALQNVDFILTKGTTCEADCTYAGDDLIHAECEGINGCSFCPPGPPQCSNPSCTPGIAASSCNLAKIGWIREYDDPSQPECQASGCVIECGEGCPIGKIKTKSSVTCDDENIIKVTKLVTYKGKLAKLVIVTCG